MPFVTTPSAGINILDTYTTPPPHGTTTVVSLSDGGEAILVQALSEISTFAYALVSPTGTAQMSTTVLAAATKRGGWAQSSIGSGMWGWLQTSGGSVKGNLAANCAPNVPLYTTATAGVLDDATVTGALVAFATATQSISNATAVSLLVGRGQGIASGQIF